MDEFPEHLHSGNSYIISLGLKIFRKFSSLEVEALCLACLRAGGWLCKGGAAGWAVPKDSLGKGPFFSGNRSLAKPPSTQEGTVLASVTCTCPDRAPARTQGSNVLQ